MVEIKNETHILTSKHLPHDLIEIPSKRYKENHDIPNDLIEIILFRLPVKSLLRFKAVCKQWKATISGYRFAETRLRLSKNSSCLYLEEVICPETRVRLVEFDVENDEFRVFSAVDHPPLKSTTRRPIKCHCDGLYLVLSSIAPNQIEYVLWNPSCRWLKKLRHPHIFDTEYNLKSGMCYDPLIKDYKIVFFDDKHYAVFYCRNNSWSETKKMNVHPLRVSKSGVPMNGSIYWLSEVEERRFELVCFDGKYEEFKNVVLKLEAGTQYAHLISSVDGLHLSCNKPSSDARTYEMVIMKRAGDDETWTEIKAELPFCCEYVVPLCLTLENKLLFKVYRPGYGVDYLLYSFSKMAFKEFQNSLDLRITSNLFPYVENLFSI